MKTAVYPSKFAAKFGFPVQRSEGGNALSHDTGKPVAKMDPVYWASWLKKNGTSTAKVSAKNKTDGPGKQLIPVVKAMFVRSQTQGYLTLQDIAELAGLSLVNYGVGSKDFRNVVNKVVRDGCLTEGTRGLSVGEATTTMDVDDTTADDADIAALMALLG